jgi:hypothetical protein
MPRSIIITTIRLPAEVSDRRLISGEKNGIGTVNDLCRMVEVYVF